MLQVQFKRNGVPKGQTNNATINSDPAYNTCICSSTSHVMGDCPIDDAIGMVRTHIYSKLLPKHELRIAESDDDGWGPTTYLPRRNDMSSILRSKLGISDDSTDASGSPSGKSGAGDKKAKSSSTRRDLVSKRDKDDKPSSSNESSLKNEKKEISKLLLKVVDMLEK